MNRLLEVCKDLYDVGAVFAVALAVGDADADHLEAFSKD